MMVMLVMLEVEVEGLMEVAELTEAAEVVTLVSMLAEERRQCEQDHRADKFHFIKTIEKQSKFKEMETTG